MNDKITPGPSDPNKNPILSAPTLVSLTLTINPTKTTIREITSNTYFIFKLLISLLWGHNKDPSADFHVQYKSLFTQK